jgi:hypothetical protein
MKKMALFVEGGTELAFTEKLLREVAGEKNITIRTERDRGGVKSKRMRTLVGTVEATGEVKYEARIVDCGNDDRVRSVIIDNYKTLCTEEFQAIVGIRDVRGNRDGVEATFADVVAIRRWMDHGVSTQPIRPVIVLAVMETEAWFLAEHSHFIRIDPQFTLEYVTQVLAFNPSVGDVEQRAQPSEDLHLVYQTVGKAYLTVDGKKSKVTTQPTIDALDSGIVFLELKDRVPGIRPLISAIEEFLN